MAMIEAYSVPCAPETSASVGPGFVPRTTTTGICVPGSLPAGTLRYPVTFSPGFADAVPTVKRDCCARTKTGSEQRANANSKRRIDAWLLLRGGEDSARSTFE